MKQHFFVGIRQGRGIPSTFVFGAHALFLGGYSEINGIFAAKQRR